MKKTITIGLAVTMLFALTASGTAAAHERTEKTKISIKPKAKTIDEGDKVTFQGKLKSDWDKCFAHQTVTLYKGNNADPCEGDLELGQLQVHEEPQATPTPGTWSTRAGASARIRTCTAACRASPRTP